MKKLFTLSQIGYLAMSAISSAQCRFKKAIFHKTQLYKRSIRKRTGLLIISAKIKNPKKRASFYIIRNAGLAVGGRF